MNEYKLNKINLKYMNTWIMMSQLVKNSVKTFQTLVIYVHSCSQNQLPLHLNPMDQWLLYVWGGPSNYWGFRYPTFSIFHIKKILDRTIILLTKASSAYPFNWALLSRVFIHMWQKQCHCSHCNVATSNCKSGTSYPEMIYIPHSSFQKVSSETWSLRVGEDVQADYKPW